MPQKQAQGKLSAKIAVFAAKNEDKQRTEEPMGALLYLRQVQQQLGHSSPTITAAMYADVTFEDMQDGLSGLYG